jgi:hypothetical protein
VKFGDIGKLFYVILMGSCEVWVPVAFREMKLVIKDFMKNCHTLTDASFFEDSMVPEEWLLEFYGPKADLKTTHKSVWLKERIS